MQEYTDANLHENELPMTFLYLGICMHMHPREWKLLTKILVTYEFNLRSIVNTLQKAETVTVMVA